MDFESLRTEILSKIHLLNGDFILKRAGYEKELAKKLGKGYKHKNSRDFDLQYQGFDIEVKKTTSCAWFNILRYLDEKPSNNVTLILFYNAKTKHVYDIALINSNVMRDKIFENYPKNFDYGILKTMEKNAMHQLNMQVNFTKKDLQKLSI
jgi:hypothetical protein